MGREKWIFYGEDLEVFQKEWVPSLLGVEFGVLVEGKTSIVCIGDTVDRREVRILDSSKEDYRPCSYENEDDDFLAEEDIESEDDSHLEMERKMREKMISSTTEFAKKEMQFSDDNTD